MNSILQQILVRISSDKKKKKLNNYATTDEKMQPCITQTSNVLHPVQKVNAATISLTARARSKLVCLERGGGVSFD